MWPNQTSKADTVSSYRNNRASKSKVLIPKKNYRQPAFELTSRNRSRFKQTFKRNLQEKSIELKRRASRKLYALHNTHCVIYPVCYTLYAGNKKSTARTVWTPWIFKIVSLGKFS